MFNYTNPNLTYFLFIRLTEDLYQTAKVAKVLLLLNAGKGHEFKGKSLSQIEVEQEEIFDDNDNTDEASTHIIETPPCTSEVIS